MQVELHVEIRFEDSAPGCYLNTHKTVDLPFPPSIGLWIWNEWPTDDPLVVSRIEYDTEKKTVRCQCDPFVDVCKYKDLTDAFKTYSDAGWKTA